MDFGHMYGLYGHYVASVPLIVFMTMSLMVQLTACSTHWVLSDDGRLKSVDFSPYVMRDSGDLINLMKQEQRVGESIHLEKQKEKLMTELRIMTLKANDQRLQRKAESSDDPDAYDENDAQSVQKNCAPMFSEGKEKERSLMELDHYYSITLPLALFGISLSEHLGTYHKASLTPQPPNCGEHRQLTHVNNIHQFTNLRGMKESKDFVLRPEPSLRAIFSHQPLDQVGHIIQKSLQQNSESWVTYNLATLFWRIKGNSQEALKCVSHAIDLSPDDALAISLLHMAAILHKHYYHADGQFVAWVALENCKERAKGFIHMFLANVQCLPTLNQFDNCVESLNAILQSENFQLDETKGLTLHSGVKEKIKAVQCIRHFRAIVEREQSVLAEIVAKERELQTVSEELSEKHKEIESFKISDEEILMKEHYYRMYTNKQFNQMMEFVKKVKSTTQGTNALLHSLNPNINVEHLRDKRTRNEQQWGSFDLQGDENVPSLEHFKTDDANENVVSELLTDQPTQPSNSADGTNLHEDNTNYKDIRKDAKQIWQRSTEGSSLLERERLVQFNDEVSRDLAEKGGCDHVKGVTTVHVNKFMKAFPTIFIPLPVVNFSILDSLTTLINVPSSGHHPLPWYPPTCPPPRPQDSSEQSEREEEVLDFTAMLGKWSKTSSNYEAESHLKHHLMDLFTGNGDEKEEVDVISLGEVGQRIEAAIEKQLEPAWAIMNYASLYWRVTGHPLNALQCLNYAYATSPKQFRDIIMSNVMNVLYRAERSEDVLHLADSVERKISTQTYLSPRVFYSLALAFVAGGQYREAEHLMVEGGSLESDQKQRDQMKTYVFYIACQHLHVAEQCLSNNDKSSPQCQNAHAVVQSTLDADCDCAHLFPEMVPSQKSAASMSVQKSDGGGDLFAAQISNNKCASNLHFSKNGNWAGISRGVCGSQLHKPTVPDFVTGAQLSPEITSRRIDYASPVETRAICEQRGDVHSCMYFRKHELGTPSCNHPRACDPKVFNDASQTIIADGSLAIEIYGKDLYDVEFMAVVDSRETVEMIFYMEEALAQPFDLVMTIFYQERAKASPELPPRVITSSSELSQDHDFDEDFDDEEDEHHAIEAEEDISESKGSSERTSRQLNKDSPSTDFDEKLVGDKAVGGVDDPKCPSGSVGKCNNGEPSKPEPATYNFWASRGEVWTQMTYELTKYCELEASLSRKKKKSSGGVNNATTDRSDETGMGRNDQDNLKREQVQSVPKLHDLSIMFTPTTPTADVMFQSILMTEEDCETWPHNSVSTASSLIQPSVFKYRVEGFIDWHAQVRPSRVTHLPVCTNTIGLSPIDGFAGVKQRKASAAHYKPEKTLRDAFLAMADYQLSLQQMASKLSQALDDDADSFVLLNLAVTYWRIVGDSKRAIDCIRQALYYSPMNTKPMAWISLANILQRSGFLEDAHFFSLLSLRTFPSFATYATTANIRATQHAWPDALAFYEGARQLNPDIREVVTDMKTVQCLKMHSETPATIN
ncbi:tetratricopeptide repeat protein 17-like isoform X2 [Symsagittifera roscoffensis]|uniref:tetratricopeptide repeat protein 17-like isoform X2 n=1 Tax=Symsagittifera roscoffensis TaxID=84072 RepID=UPI00307B8049